MAPVAFTILVVGLLLVAHVAAVERRAAKRAITRMSRSHVAPTRR